MLSAAMASIPENILQVQARIAAACAAYARVPGSVSLLAVSKTCPGVSVRAAFAAGQRDFGENYVQEALAKIAELEDIRGRLRWHLIGPLQSNKTRDVAAHFDWVHSIDRAKLADRPTCRRSPAWSRACRD
jgi:pyridoxal phosphate enzyme (YggS family)